MTVNVGWEVLALSSQTFDQQDKVLTRQIQDLSLQREKMQLLAKLMHTLSLNIQNTKGIDFNQDEDAKKTILAAHRCYPHLFDHFIKGFPDGILSQELQAHQVDHVGSIVDAALQDVLFTEVTISPLKPEDLQAIVRGIESQLDIESANTNQVAFEINRIYGDREQVVKIVHEILRQLSELNKGIHRNMASRG